MASVEHVRINLKQIAERLAISEADLARSMTAGMSMGRGGVPPMGTFSGGPAAGSAVPNASITSQDRDADEHSALLLPGSHPQYGFGVPRPVASAPIAVGSYTGSALRRESHLGDEVYVPAQSINAADSAAPPLQSSFAIGSIAGSLRRPLVLGSSVRGAGVTSLLSPSVQRSAAVPVAAAAGVASGGGDGGMGSYRRTPPMVPSSVSRGGGGMPPIGGASMSRAGGVPSMGGASVGLASSLRGAVPMMVRVSRALSSLDGPATLPPPAPATDDAVLGGDGGQHDLVLQANPDGGVSFSVVARDPTPSRNSSKLSRGDSKLTEPAAINGGGGASSSASVDVPMQQIADTANDRKRVQFATEPISSVTIFATQDQGVVLQVQYSRPAWCLALGAVAAILRALAWALVAHTMKAQLSIDYAARHEIANPDNAFGDEIQDITKAVAVATRMGFEIYAGCAIVFALLTFIFWRPSAKDWKSLRGRKERRRVAISIVSGTIARLGLVLGLAFVTSATNVCMHYALPIVWVTGGRSALRKRPTVFVDLIAAGIMCASFAVLLAGDMREKAPHWEIDRRWIALPIVVGTSALRGLQRQVAKSLKAHFSHRLMLMATMLTDAVAMFAAAIAADGGVISEVLRADSGEATTAIVAVFCLAFAAAADVVVSRYFDMITFVALASLSLPATIVFFEVFDLMAPAILPAFMCAFLALISTGIALGSSEMHRKVKHLVLTESDSAVGSDTSSEHSSS